MRMSLLADRQVTIVGAGIGGAGAALLLAADGARVTLLERVREPRAVGAGILLQPNGLAVLHGLGMEAALRARSFAAATVPISDGLGRPILSTRMPDFGDGLDHALVLRRSDLFEILHDAVQAQPRIQLVLGAEVLGASPTGAVTVQIQRSDGRVETQTLNADLVIGADGVDSRTRAGGDFGARVRRTGISYVRGISPHQASQESVSEAWTELGIFGIGPLRRGTYFFTSARAPAVAAALAKRDLDAFREVWRHAYPPSVPLLAGLRGFDDLLLNEVVRVDCARFVDGRLVLLGDAAHAMAPNLGQGANSALVDAAVLTHELRHAASLDEALARYDRRRRPAVRRVQDVAGRLTRLTDLRAPLVRGLRDNALRLFGRLSDGSAEARKAQQEDPAWLLATTRQRG